LVAVRFYLWNGGNTAIRREHILEPLTVTVMAPDARILRSKLVAVSRPVTGLKVQPAPGSPDRAILIDFTILEPGDGGAFEVLFEGKPNADLDLRGTVEGAKRIRTTRSPRSESLTWGYLSSLAEILWSLGAIAAAFAILLVMGWVIGWLQIGTSFLRALIPERTRERVAKIKATVGAGVGVILLVGLFLALFVFGPLKRAREEIGKSLLDEVPVALRGNPEGSGTGARPN
jgi:hypothetical protein